MHFAPEVNTQICIFGDFNARTGSLEDMFLIDENICNNLNLDIKRYK